MKKKDIVTYKALKDTEFLEVVYVYKSLPYIRVRPVGSKSKGLKVLKNYLTKVE